MSRFHEWTSAEHGISVWLQNRCYAKDIRGIKGKRDNYIGVQVSKIINKYSKAKSLTGSYSTRCLIIGRQFNEFAYWCKQNLTLIE